MSKELILAAEKLNMSAITCEVNSAINTDEGNFAQRDLNDELAQAYRAGAIALEQEAAKLAS